MWPEKNRQMSIKAAQKWLHYKKIDFDNFTKKCGLFGQPNCCQRLLKVAQSPINCPIWSLCWCNTVLFYKSLWFFLSFCNSIAIARLQSFQCTLPIKNKIWQFCQKIIFRKKLLFSTLLTEKFALPGIVIPKKSETKMKPKTFCPKLKSTKNKN